MNPNTNATVKTKTVRSRAKLFLVGCGLVLAALSLPAAARADATGYPCNVQFYPGSSSVGNFGYINFQLYSGTNCTSTFLGSFYLATTGSTIGFVFYNADQIQTQMRNLVSAWQTNRQVTANNISTGQNGNVNVANFLYFFRS
jgi:hypothetical protein